MCSPGGTPGPRGRRAQLLRGAPLAHSSTRMSLTTLLFGRRLASDEEEKEQIGPLAGIPVLGLDALASAAYGPEAALTVLIPLGVLGLGYVVPISAMIIALLTI